MNRKKICLGINSLAVISECFCKQYLNKRLLTLVGHYYMIDQGSQSGCCNQYTLNPEILLILLTLVWRYYMINHGSWG